MKVLNATFIAMCFVSIFLGAGTRAEDFPSCRHIAEIDGVDVENQLRLFTGLAKKCDVDCKPIRKDLHNILAIRIQRASMSPYRNERDMHRLHELIDEATVVMSKLERADAE